MLLLPMTFLASVFMARELMPGWIQNIARFNPVDWATGAGRAAVSADVDLNLVLSHRAYMVAFARRRVDRHPGVQDVPALGVTPTHPAQARADRMRPPRLDSAPSAQPGSEQKQKRASYISEG
jgi:hypothetical protein